jgi:hypothetical protein
VQVSACMAQASELSAALLAGATPGADPDVQYELA